MNSDLLQRIGSAARLLDLRGDTAAAIAILEAVAVEATRRSALPVQVEAIVFLAEVHISVGAYGSGLAVLDRLSGLVTDSVEPDLVEGCVARAAQLRAVALRALGR